MFFNRTTEPTDTLQRNSMSRCCNRTTKPTDTFKEISMSRFCNRTKGSLEGNFHVEMLQIHEEDPKKP